MMQSENVYRCYSNCLKEHLTNGGVRYFLVAKDIKSNKVFYAYEKTERLFDLIQEWEHNNPKMKK